MGMSTKKRRHGTRTATENALGLIEEVRSPRQQAGRIRKRVQTV